MKTLILFLLVALGLGGYLVYSWKIDPEEAKKVIENVDDYAKAVANSVGDAQKAVDTINARNAETDKRIQESIK